MSFDKCECVRKKMTRFELEIECECLEKLSQKKISDPLIFDEF